MTLLVRNLIKCTKVNDSYGITGYALLLVSDNDLTIYLCSIRSISHTIPGSFKRADWPKLHDIHKIISERFWLHLLIVIYATLYLHKYATYFTHLW